MTDQEIKDLIQDSGSDVLNMDKLRKVLLSLSSKGGTLDVFQGLTANGTTSATTSVMEYGVNVFTTATATDYCTKLPQPTTGMSTTVLNNSGSMIYIHPSNPGGKINNLAIDTPLGIPNDGIAVTFICTLNPLPGVWNTVYNTPGTEIVYEWEFDHTTGTMTSAHGLPGGVFGAPNSPAPGGGFYPSPTFTIDPYTGAMIWNQTSLDMVNTLSPAAGIIDSVRLDTNVIATDLPGGVGNGFGTSIERFWHNAAPPYMIYNQSKIKRAYVLSFPGSAYNFFETSVAGSPAYVSPGVIGAGGTLYSPDIDWFVGGPGVLGMNTIGAADAISTTDYYYTIESFISAAMPTKLYKFKMTITIQ